VSPAATLPRTSATSGVVTTLGLVLLGVGALLVMAARRRRTG
jgi:LPXTG-motif cell wall-anchored protein